MFPLCVPIFLPVKEAVQEGFPLQSGLRGMSLGFLGSLFPGVPCPNPIPLFDHDRSICIPVSLSKALLGGFVFKTAITFKKTFDYKCHVSSVLKKRSKKSVYKACVSGNLVYFCTRIQGEVLIDILKNNRKEI